MPIRAVKVKVVMLNKRMITLLVDGIMDKMNKTRLPLMMFLLGRAYH